MSVDSSGSAVDILVDAVSELDSSLSKAQETNNTQAVAIQSLNTATNNLYALIAQLQNQIATLSSKVNTIENQQEIGQTSNWWGNGSFDNTVSNIVDGRVGSSAVAISGQAARISLNLETTSNLAEGDWTPATNVSVSIPVNNEDAQFFRMGFE